MTLNIKPVLFVFQVHTCASLCVESSWQLRTIDDASDQCDVRYTKLIKAESKVCIQTLKVWIDRPDFGRVDGQCQGLPRADAQRQVQWAFHDPFSGGTAGIKGTIKGNIRICREA